jgi:hypothetical protein
MEAGVDNEAIHKTLRSWLVACTPNERAALGNHLVSEIWALHRELSGPRDTNASRKQKARRDELERFIDTLRRNARMYGTSELLEQQEAYRGKCRAARGAGLYGLYMPVIDKRRLSTFQAIWRLADGSYLTVTPVCDFKALYESLSLPRVPVAFDIDEACLLTDF